MKEPYWAPFLCEPEFVHRHRNAVVDRPAPASPVTKIVSVDPRGWLQDWRETRYNIIVASHSGLARLARDPPERSAGAFLVLTGSVP